MATANVSPITGQTYYSSGWETIKDTLAMVDIGEGKLSAFGSEKVAGYQERVDRLIDDELSEVYHVPFRSINRMQPDGVTREVFPGQLRRIALYWVCGLIILNEFQQLSQNTTEQGTEYVNIARRGIFALKRSENRLVGQEFKSNISRTIPPGLQPPARPEANF